MAEVDHGQVGSQETASFPCSKQPDREPAGVAPANPWEATVADTDAAIKRLQQAARAADPCTVQAADVRLLIHEYRIANDTAEACNFIRLAAKRVTGGNMSFVDDDVAVMEVLAFAAVRAGLTQGLHPRVAKTAAVACAAHPFATEEGSQDPAASDGDVRAAGEDTTEPKTETGPV